MIAECTFIDTHAQTRTPLYLQTSRQRTVRELTIPGTYLCVVFADAVAQFIPDHVREGHLAGERLVCLVELILARVVGSARAPVALPGLARLLAAVALVVGAQGRVGLLIAVPISGQFEQLGRTLGRLRIFAIVLLLRIATGEEPSPARDSLVAGGGTAVPSWRVVHDDKSKLNGLV